MDDDKCPFCGAADYDPEYGCPKCCGFQWRCPICESLIYAVDEKGNGYDTLCACVVGAYGYGPDEFIHDKKPFHAWRKRHLKAIVAADERADIDKEEMLEELMNDPHEIQELAEKTTWMKVGVYGEDGAHGHCYPVVYFFVRPEDQDKLKK